MKHTYSHIDLDERRKIARWRAAGLSVDVIAEKLGRHRSTIFREIRRNTFVDKAALDLDGYYCGTFYFQVRHANVFNGFTLEILSCPDALRRPPSPIDISLIRVCVKSICRFMCGKEGWGLGAGP